MDSMTVSELAQRADGFPMGFPISGDNLAQAVRIKTAQGSHYVSIMSCVDYRQKAPGED